MVKIFSLNVRGLRQKQKRREIFLFLKNQRADIYFLQETHSQDQDEKFWIAEWKNPIVFSHGKSDSKGTAVLINNNNIKILSEDMEESGRGIILIRSFMNEVRWNEKGNHITMIKNLKDSKNS